MLLRNAFAKCLLQTWLINQLQNLKGDAVEAVISPAESRLSPISEQLMSPVTSAPPVWDLSGKLELPLTKAMAL